MSTSNHIGQAAMIRTGSSHATLLDELMHLEVELHKHETHRNSGRLAKLLHPEFLEFGRSGVRYTREEVLKLLSADAFTSVIDARHFELAVMTAGIVLLTYLSADVDTNGNRHGHAVRSSLWVLTDEGWRMRFHQGTPTTAAIFDGK